MSRRAADQGSYRVAIDIGGTFTDLAAVDRDGRLILAKTDTTPARLDDGVMAALAESLDQVPSGIVVGSDPRQHVPRDR